MKRINIHLSKDKDTTFWCDEHEWETFKKNCHREGDSADNTLRKFILHFNETKRNPSVKLDVFLPQNTESPMKVVCLHLGGATHEGEVLCHKKGSLWIQGIECYRCEHNQLKASKRL